MQLSFWEQDAMLDADFIVVGAGLIGLQTALELHERRPGARIIVLERGLLPCGASSRNAGFACFGSLTEILHDLDAMGESAALALIERRWKGLRRLRKRLSDDAIEYEAFGGFELLPDANLTALHQLEQVNNALRPLFGKPVFTVDTPSLRTSGFGPQVKALVRNPLEGQVHSGKLMRSLAKLTAQRGIEIRYGVQVTEFEENACEVKVKSMGDIVFRAPRVAVCTNGMTSSLLPSAGITPARGQVIVTAPIPGLPWRGAYHMEQGFYYFRNIGERVLLGGGRHLDSDAEATCDSHVTQGIQSALEKMLSDVIVPGRATVIEYRWAGIMGFSLNKQPIARLMSDRIAFGFGCNGMGLALGAEIAAETAGLLL